VSAIGGGGDDRRFTPTSGTGAGWFGVGLAALVLVVVLLDDRSLPTIRFCFVVGIFGLLVWCYMLRPRVVIGASEVELRNAFSSWHVALADVRRVAVRAVTRIYTDEGRFDGVAIGRPVRSLRGRTSTKRAVGLTGLGATYLMDQNERPKGPQSTLDADGVADFVTEQILLAADRARDASQPGGPPRRSWARLELAGLVLLTAAFVASFFV